MTAARSQDARARRALDQALDLVITVRDFGQDEITAWIRSRSQTELEALAVALAALVPEDRTPADLLAWLDGPAKPRPETRPRLVVAPRPEPRQPAPCGTRAAFVRHKAHGETPCGPCTEASRKYYAARYHATTRAQDARAAGRTRKAS